MKPDVKKQWVEALRSGKYEQGTCCLKRGREGGKYTYCCLGVLADVINPHYSWTLRSGSTLTYEFYGRSGYLPADFAEQIGLKAEDQSTLVAKNDSGDKFDEIADYIEQSL